MIDNPARRQFIERRIVNTPLQPGERDHWLDMFQRWEDTIDAGEEPDQGHARWVHQTRLKLWDGTFSAPQVAHMVRSYHLTRLWDQEHREPRAVEDFDWHTGRAKPPYSREISDE